MFCLTEEELFRVPASSILSMRWQAFSSVIKVRRSSSAANPADVWHVLMPNKHFRGFSHKKSNYRNKSDAFIIMTF